MSGAIFIDDTGTPGSEPPSKFLHRNRKSWAAVVVPESVKGELTERWSRLQVSVSEEFKVDELHFTDIYSGNGNFKGVSREKRFEIFEFAVQVLSAYELPTFFQTCSPEFRNEISKKFKIHGRHPFLNLDDPSDFALLFLIAQVRRFLLNNPTFFSPPLPCFVDAGRAANGADVHLGLEDVLEDGLLRFVDSKSAPFIQIADFVAFSVGRIQWLLSRGNLGYYDKLFLNILSHLQVDNLDRIEVVPEGDVASVFEDAIQRDRAEKGLGSFPIEEETPTSKKRKRK